MFYFIVICYVIYFWGLYVLDVEVRLVDYGKNAHY